MKLKTILNKKKQQLDEGFIEDILTNIFFAVNKNKIDTTYKKIRNDPNFKYAISNYKKSIDDLKDLIKKNPQYFKTSNKQV